MQLDGLFHNLEGDCETASTYELGYQQHLTTEVHRLERSDDRSVTQEDQKKCINFLAKECEKVESRFILSDTTSSVNQLERDQLKISLGEGAGENHDGFQSPTKVMDTISSSGLKCPPAPMKPKATPLMKRKRESVNLQQDEFVNEVELVLRLLSSEDDKKLKRARLLAAAGRINDEAMKS